jgi:hypothetical protein
MYLSQNVPKPGHIGAKLAGVLVDIPECCEPVP